MSRSENGRYSVWYHTPRGESSGILELNEGKIFGQGTSLSYEGSYQIVGDRFTAEIKTRRFNKERPSVLGVDEMEIVVTGKAPGRTIAACTGHAKEVPDLVFDVTLVRLKD